MAKKKTTTKTSGSGFNFSDFDAALSKVPGMEHGSIIKNNTFSEITEYIGTGNFLMNAQLSGSLFGGVPNSRSLGLVGDPETGKTFICLNIAHNAVKMGYYVFWCDTEGALEREDVEKFKIDTEKFRYQPTKTVEQFKIFVANLISMKANYEKEHGEPFKFIVFLDSMGMLNTEKELNDLAENKSKSDMGIKAKQVRALFRAITLDMTGAKMPLIATNHTTIGGIGSYTGPTKESAGGDGPIFAFSNVLFFSKKILREGDDSKTATGILIKSKPYKARKQQKIPISLHVSYQGGMNPYVGLEEFVSWEACGIQKGKVMTPKDYEKQNKEGVQFTYDNVDETTGEITQVEAYFVPSETGRWCVRHMGKSLPAARYLFTKEVFTKEVLKNLDENVIQARFKLPEMESDEDDEKFDEIADAVGNDDNN